MSIGKKPSQRLTPEGSVAHVSLPKWDRDGNLVTPLKTKVLPQSVKDVDEIEVKPPTIKELEQIREDAYNEGFEQGYQNGLNQGLREGEVEGRKAGLISGEAEGLETGKKIGAEKAEKAAQEVYLAQQAVLKTVTDSLANQIPQEQAELEKAMLALSIRIARQVLQNELKREPEYLANLVHAAVQSLPNPDEKLTLHVNPYDAEQVKLFADSHWAVEPDIKVSQGGCVVKSGYSYVDYTLEHRFDTTISHLLTNLTEIDPSAVKKPLVDDENGELFNTPDANEIDASVEDAALNHTDVQITEQQSNSQSTEAELKDSDLQLDVDQGEFSTQPDEADFESAVAIKPKTSDIIDGSTDTDIEPNEVDLDHPNN